MRLASGHFVAEAIALWKVVLAAVRAQGQLHFHPKVQGAQASHQQLLVVLLELLLVEVFEDLSLLGILVRPMWGN